MFAAKE